PVAIAPALAFALSLHHALPTYGRWACDDDRDPAAPRRAQPPPAARGGLRRAAAVRARAGAGAGGGADGPDRSRPARAHRRDGARDRKSTRLNSSHVSISYAVFS